MKNSNLVENKVNIRYCQLPNHEIEANIQKMTEQNDQQNQLIERALKAMGKAYAPYSNFQVGASILDENNQLHAGCNVENSAYPLGVCAEGSAISNMILSGSQRIKKILIVSSGDKMVTPCGGCRQKIREFGDKETKIQIYHNKTISTFSIEDLLPHSFSKDHLNSQ